MPFLIALAAAAAAPQPGALKLFQDWTVGCDNGRACQAVALMPEGPIDRASTLVLTRGPEPDAVPAIRIVSPDGPAASAEVAGRSYRLTPVPEGAAPRAADLPALLAAFRRADGLTLRDLRGQKLPPVSLNGATAALLWLDEQQQRVGTRSALIRPGPRPAETVPPPPALPVIRQAPASAKKKPPRLDRAALLASHTDNSCDGRFEPGDVEIDRLDAQATLVIVPDRCSSGAYNIAHVVLIADNKGRVRPARFDTPPGWGEIDNVAVNAGWDARGRRLTTYAKARGLGDCGAAQEFVWDGTRFRLTELAQMGECRGSGDWIVTYRAEVR